jgi:PIN domain nuclease of toxin-antitoxin system
MKVLLDTCTFLWLTSDATELSEKAKSVFQDTGNLIYLSSVSIWEMLVKYQLGKLPLPAEPDNFIKQQ